MEYIILLHVGDVVKPIEEATPEERKALEEKCICYSKCVPFMITR